jgi:uncharacterized protein YecT (DUF1311 family)
MPKRVFVWALLGLLIGGSGAQAQSAEWRKCVDSTKTNVEWAQCGEAEIKRQEARLNAAWKQAFACFEGTEMAAPKQSFLEEQRLWVKWKDASCTFYSDGQAFGREGQVLSYPACRAAVILQRTQFLEKFGKDCG